MCIYIRDSNIVCTFVFLIRIWLRAFLDNVTNNYSIGRNIMSCVILSFVVIDHDMTVLPEITY